jgi:putative phosphoesterase
MKLGIISDTHGHLHSKIHTLFNGVDEIIHAGDIGKEDILLELQTIAPVTAVRGNMDRYEVTRSYCEFLAPSFAGVQFFIVHDIGTPSVIKRHLLPFMKKYRPRVVVFGHTHKPYIKYLGDVLYFNPGSARSGRSGSNASIGILEIINSQVSGEIIPLTE